MSKYIDAEKLVAEIDKKWKELADKNAKIGGGKYDIEISTCLSIKNLVESLQQEQPSEDLEQAVRAFAFNTGKQWQKMQMMKDAVEGHCFVSPFTPSSLFVQTEIFESNKGFRHGETCKVIIINEDEK